MSLPLAVQATFELYEYPCKKYPEAIRNRRDPPAPTAAEVCTYLREYIDEKKMASNFRFNTTVKNISRGTSETEWFVEWMDGNGTTAATTTTREAFSFVVVCTGLVSVKPNVVPLPGSDAFLGGGGLIMHSSVRRNA
jgi:cation diffusion facilitator CzcD-associated flavoprotein CzcO